MLNFSKLGLYLINVNIIDITDESNYINSIGKKAAAGAVNKALVDVANAERDGAIGKANADREREVQVAQNVAESEKGQKLLKSTDVFSFNRRSNWCPRRRTFHVLKSHPTKPISRRKRPPQCSEPKLPDVPLRWKSKRHNTCSNKSVCRAEEIVREEISKTQIEIAAEAEAERQRRSVEADAVLARYNAEAEGTKAVLEAKANGYKQLVASAGGDVKAAATLLMVEKIEEIVARQTEAIANLQIDKIAVWDSGNGGEGGSTANFVSSLIRSLPPVHDVAKMAGVDLPDYLGSMKEERIPSK